MKRTFETLTWEHVGSTLEVTLHREPCNEIGPQTLADFEEVARYLQQGAGGATALLWTSAQRRGFCAGADLKALQQGMEEQRSASVTEGLGPRAKSVANRVVRRVARSVIRRRVGAFIDRIHAVFDAFDTAPLLTVAATHGVVFGGGFELALTADVIVADKSTRFAFPEMRLGFIPGFGGIPRLERELSGAMVRDLLLTGRSLSAKRAHELGLVAHLVSRGQAVDVARGVCAQAEKFDAKALVRAKQFIKPLPVERLAAEKALFVDMVLERAAEDGLADFVGRDDVMPWLPK